MNNEKMGKFISEMRKSQNLTQKDLASRLEITDKAISKWERGISCPDISLLIPLAQILGVTTSELLNGEKGASLKNPAKPWWKKPCCIPTKAPPRNWTEQEG